ncbi:type II toxin-antitoxin system RelB/DinJ family antitoxin [Patescibacteria group bacterium]|nr:type II toxin-antitoxin system RelB/DinJ family antitoxin [Patescibacteria group bacterium]MBU1703636.1 type II toxin-antitoxin system RelB/DinJ family antitoxin [Patescibacteria group bacterium]MBU1954209.1 type II toxin-antitoxin system RelB/DinJ family antitoxin [Patescibacteria group bacterium]
MTTIQIRIDENTKNEAKKIFDKLGIDMSTAIKMYLKRVVAGKGIPFVVYASAEQEMNNFHLLSEKSFAELWANKEDDIYDEFYNKKG